jgi:hypothetical protein
MKNSSAAVSNSDLSNLSLDEEYNKLFGVPDEDGIEIVWNLALLIM